MKKALLSLVCLWVIGFGEVRAQEIHLFQEGAKWLYNYTSNSEPPSPATSALIQYKIEGDTFIHNKWYNNVRHTEMSTTTFGQGPNDHTITYNVDSNGLLRYDSSTSRIYLCSLLDSQETMFYDFLLEIGDTLLIGGGPCETLTVSEIDSLFFYGQYFKRYHSQYDAQDLTLVNQGFGSTAAFDFPATCVSNFRVPWYSLICFSFRDSIWFESSGYNCSELTLPNSLREISGSSAFIYPNPATTSLSIQTTNFQPQTLSIFDMSGRKVMEEKYSPQIDISALQAGGYFIELKNEETVVRKRWVKGG